MVKRKTAKKREAAKTSHPKTINNQMPVPEMALKILSPEYREILSNNIQIDNTNVNNALDNFNSFSEEINKYLPNDEED